MAKTVADYNGNWDNYIRYEFLRPALKYGVRYEEFWKLTPLSLSDIIYSYSERQKENVMLNDISNWQLGQYVRMAVGDCLSGKNTSIYPKEPMFSKGLKNNNEELSEKQKELETMKFKEFFDNLGNYVRIKKK